jgi:hypothetical protein
VSKRLLFALACGTIVAISDCARSQGGYMPEAYTHISSEKNCRRLGIEREVAQENLDENHAAGNFDEAKVDSKYLSMAEWRARRLGCVDKYGVLVSPGSSD